MGLSLITTGQDTDSKRFNDMDVHAARDLIAANEGNVDFILLDTRTRIEFDKGHIKGAYFLDYNAEDYWEQVQSLEKNKTYLLYCHSGGRSGETVKYMKENGFAEAHNMTGGIIAWKRALYPVIRPEKE
jgi:rhodanese-related sulfurtransferase